MTPLKGADSQVYAIAQGNILVGGAGASAGGSSVQINQLNGGRIGGAIIERGVPTTFARDGYIYLEMNNTDFGTAQNVVTALNRKFGQARRPRWTAGWCRCARPWSSRPRPLPVPDRGRAGGARAHRGQGHHQRPHRLGGHEPHRDDRGSGSGHGNLSVIINRQNQVSQPDTPSPRETVVVPNTQIEVRQENGSLQRVNTSANLADVVGPERAGRHAAGPAGHPAGHEVRRRCAPNSRLFNGKAHPEALRASPRRGAAADRQSRIRAAPWAQWITDVMTYTNGAAGRAGRQESVFDLGRLSDLKRDVKHDPDGTAQRSRSPSSSRRCSCR